MKLSVNSRKKWKAIWAFVGLAHENIQTTIIHIIFLKMQDFCWLMLKRYRKMMEFQEEKSLSYHWKRFSPLHVSMRIVNCTKLGKKLLVLDCSLIPSQLFPCIDTHAFVRNYTKKFLVHFTISLNGNIL